MGGKHASIVQDLLTITGLSSKEGCSWEAPLELSLPDFMEYTTNDLRMVHKHSRRPDLDAAYAFDFEDHTGKFFFLQTDSFAKSCEVSPTNFGDWLSFRYETNASHRCYTPIQFHWNGRTPSAAKSAASSEKPDGAIHENSRPSAALVKVMRKSHQRFTRSSSSIGTEEKPCT